MPDSQTLELEAVTKQDQDDRVSLRFDITNTGRSKVYEFIKLYVGSAYIGLQYLDMDQDETKTAEFSVDTAKLDPQTEIVLTTSGRNEGVLLKDEYSEIGSTATPGQEPEPTPDVKEEVEQVKRKNISQEDWDEAEQALEEEEPPEKQEILQRLREEYEDLQEQQEHEETEKEKDGFLRSIVNSIFGKSEDEQSREQTEQEQQEEQGETDSEEKEEQGDQEEDERDVEPEEDDKKHEQQESGLLPSEQVRRLETGIMGFDEKIQGGIVEGTMNLVTGKTGTGKTAFCASFLKQGAENREPGVYVTTEEREEDIKADIRSMFGWDFEDLEQQGMVKILSIKPIFPSKEIENINRLVRSYISNLLDQVMHAVDEIDAERVIIDSVSIIEMFIRDEYMARVALASLLNKLRGADVTALLTGTVPETSEGLSGGGIIEFLVDTVILLEFVPVAEEHSRTLTVRKMRRTDHDTAIFPFEITPDGIQLHELH